jgi:hypothetical protein
MPLQRVILLTLLIATTLVAQTDRERLKQALEGPETTPATDEIWIWENDRLIAHCREVDAMIEARIAEMDPPPRLRKLGELPATRPAEPTRIQLLGEHQRLRAALDARLGMLASVQGREERKDKILTDVNANELLQFAVGGEATIESIELRVRSSARLLGTSEEHVVHRFTFRAFAPGTEYPTTYTLHTISTPADRLLVTTTIAGEGDPILIDRAKGR